MLKIDDTRQTIHQDSQEYLFNVKKWMGGAKDAEL